MTPRAALAGLFVMLVGAATASAQPALPLPVWPGHVEGAPVQVDALEADGEVLRGALLPKGTNVVTLPASKPVTGRVAVAKRAKALAALVAFEPSLAIAPRPMRGGGVNVDLDFRAASTRDLYRLFSDVLRTNVVVLAPPSEVTLRVRRVGAEAVLAEVARVTGAAIDRPAKGVIVVRSLTAPRIARLAAGGPKTAVEAREVRAGHLLELIRTLDGPRRAVDLLRDASLACDGGGEIDLRLKQVPAETALAVVALAGGVDVRGPRCSLPPLPAGTDPMKLDLLAVAARGTTRVAVVGIPGTGTYLLRDGDHGWRIETAWMIVRIGDTDYVKQLYQNQLEPGDLPGFSAMETPVAGPLPPDVKVRLAATIIDGRTRQAVVDVAGQPRVWTQGELTHVWGNSWVVIDVRAGEIQVRGHGGPIPLAPRKP